MHTKIIYSAIMLFFLSGCAGLATADRDLPREFTYDYQISNSSQVEIWKTARDFFAHSYGDSRSVFRVMDETDGTILGRATASWVVIDNNTCFTDYHIRFAAKNNKARLQLEIIEGVPAHSPCIGRPWPTVNGYDEITKGFNTLSKSLESALSGNSASKKLKDF